MNANTKDAERCPILSVAPDGQGICPRCSLEGRLEPTAPPDSPEHPRYTEIQVVDMSPRSGGFSVYAGVLCWPCFMSSLVGGDADV